MAKDRELTGVVCGVFGDAIQTPEGLIDGPSTSFVFRENKEGKKYVFELNPEHPDVPESGKELTITFNSGSHNQKTNRISEWEII